MTEQNRTGHDMTGVQCLVRNYRIGHDITEPVRMTNLPLCQNRLPKFGTKFDDQMRDKKQEAKSIIKSIPKIGNQNLFSQTDYQIWKQIRNQN